MKIESLYHLLALVGASNLLVVLAITKTRQADILNLNGVQDGDDVRERDRLKEKGKEKDMASTGTQENRSFFKPNADRKGSFYPSGPPSQSSSFGSVYHTSGNGYSYGEPTGQSDYPSTYGGGYISRPSSSPGTGYGTGLGDAGGGGGGGYHLVTHQQGGGGHGHHNAMALKGLLLPIAGVALLGAAAVLAKSNPVLLQLGVVSGKRKRREVRQGYPENPFVRPEGKKN